MGPLVVINIGGASAPKPYGFRRLCVYVGLAPIILSGSQTRRISQLVLHSLVCAAHLAQVVEDMLA